MQKHPNITEGEFTVFKLRLAKAEVRRLIKEREAAGQIEADKNGTTLFEETRKADGRLYYNASLCERKNLETILDTYYANHKGFK